MERYDISLLLEALKAEKNIFICGPSYYNHKKLRVYAYGGILCELPTSERSKIALPDSRYAGDNCVLAASLTSLKDAGNEARAKFLLEHLDDLLSAMKNRFTSKSKESEERRQQTLIARAHTDFHQHGGTVVCDFQSSLPRVWRQSGVGRPAFDLISFSIDQAKRGIFTLIELKCSASACSGGSGLKAHAEDMYNCVKINPREYKEELLRRLDYMKRCCLLQNPPAELNAILQQPENTVLRSAFLFTSGKGLKSREDATAQCKKYILESKEIKRDGFLYQFAEVPETVDLSSLERWETFSEGKD